MIQMQNRIYKVETKKGIEILNHQMLCKHLKWSKKGDEFHITIEEEE